MNLTTEVAFRLMQAPFSPPQEGGGNNPFPQSFSPERRLPGTNTNLPPEILGESPANNMNRGSPSSQRNIGTLADLEEEDPLIYKQEQLLEVKRSDFISPLVLAAEQNKYLV